MQIVQQEAARVAYPTIDQEILDWVAAHEHATFNEINAALAVRLGELRPVIERLKRAGLLREALDNGELRYRASLDEAPSRRCWPASLGPFTLRSFVAEPADSPEVLRAIPMFSALRKEVLAALMQRLRPSTYRRHEVLVWQGEPSETLYVIRRGVVGITHLPELAAKPQILTFLKPGDLLGEVGLLCGTSRSATATALTDVETLTLGRDDFHDLLYRYPELTLELAKMLGRRLQSTNRRIRGASPLGQIAILVGAAPGIGSTSLGCSLAAALAEQTGKPTVYTEYPDASRLPALLALPGSSDASGIHPAGAGFDVLVHRRAQATPVSLHTTLVTDLLENRYASSVVNVGAFHDFDELAYMLERASTMIVLSVPGRSSRLAMERLSATMAKLKPARKASFLRVGNLSEDGEGVGLDGPADVAIPSLAQAPLPWSIAQRGFGGMPQAFANASLALANRIGRTSEIGVYLPKVGDDGGAAHVEQTMALFARMFGGATCSDATGVWSSAASGLVADSLCIVRSFVSEAALDRHIGDVIDYVEKLKVSLAQEAIALETNGQLMVI